MGRLAISVLLAAITAAAQPALRSETGAGLTVSIDRLRRPLSSKVLRRLQTAQDYGRSGEHQRAIELLRETLVREPSSAPYVHSMLGIEYLRTGRLADALPELALGVQLLPHEAVNHSNYACALYLAGDYAASERELKRALELDRQAEMSLSLMRSLLDKARAAGLATAGPATLDNVR